MNFIKELSYLPKSLSMLDNPPKELFYKGNINLLNNFKISIVGTRSPNQYTKYMLETMIPIISKYATIISGGAVGVDTIAHDTSYPNTIMISPCSLDIIYPKQNKTLINNIAKNALILSEYKSNYFPYKFSFLDRNRIVIALSDIVFIPQGDLNSGTSVSAKIAMKLNKPIFTIPHRYNESKLTNMLLAKNYAKAIYDIDNFIKNYLSNNNNANKNSIPNDFIDIISFCSIGSSFEEAYNKFGNRLLECELLGFLSRKDNLIYSKSK